MTRVLWFRFTEKVLTEKILDPKHIKNINNHYVLEKDGIFAIFTSKPVPGIKSHFISNSNIEGEKKPQYLAEHSHKFNSNHHVFEVSNRGNVFLEKNTNVLEPLAQQILSK